MGEEETAAAGGTRAGFRADPALTATFAGLTDERQRFQDEWVRLRPDLTRARRKAGIAGGAGGLRSAGLDERAVRGPGAVRRFRTGSPPRRSPPGSPASAALPEPVRPVAE
ncbi:Uncharacterised protein [Mycobacterium tuberculosis]|nr:Uncharacterised protein [Mycobacterium tuberculosis]